MSVSCKLLKLELDGKLGWDEKDEVERTVEFWERYLRLGEDLYRGVTEQWSVLGGNGAR